MTASWWEGLQAHLASNDDGPPTCYECGESYQLRNGSEDTGFCDTCAQAMVANGLRYWFLRPHLHVGDGGGVQVAHNSLFLGNEFTGRHREGSDLDKALDAAIAAACDVPAQRDGQG
jgi:hypothetical protein